MALGLVLFSGWLFKQKGPLSEPKIVEIKKGYGVSVVANVLEENGIIKYPFLFKLKVKLSGLSNNIKAGEYEFIPQISASEVLNKIVKGDLYYNRLTIPEGLTVGEVMYMIESHPKLTGEISIDVKEGDLLPETYSFSSGMHKDLLVKDMKKQMNKALDSAWAKRTPNPYIKTKKDALILASIIEKETSINGERGLVASVFLNRLKKGMRLQTDPTVIYAITNGEFNFGRKLYRKDLQYDSPYNTYRNYGLPPGPICNPGVKAINAALNSDTSDYLYFVANGKGGHNFSKTLSEHNKNVQQWRNKRKGK